MIAGTIVLIIISIYFSWLLVLAIAWMMHSPVKGKGGASIPVTILIPCRNEAQTIVACLNSIYNQRYPSHLIEVWVIDDHSEDDTADKVIKDGRCRLIQLPAGLQGKKAALTMGVQQATNELIITRDADTVANEYWLQTIADEYEWSNADMLIGPVTLKPANSFINLFERLEFYAFTVITGATAFIGKPILCNGANLIFKKSVFNKLNGYQGNNEISSGDDVFLMNKIAADRTAKIRYIKNYKATVFTSTEDSLIGSIRQRLRWAGKNTRNTNFWNAFTGLLVLFANISWLLIAVLSVFSKQSGIYFVIITAMKCIIDILLLFLGSSFHKQGKALFAFPLMVLLYPLYITLIVIVSVMVKPTWKGRNIN